MALADLLLDVPFDILGVKFLWWTWHDTDPNIFDRSYSVPLTRWALIGVLVCGYWRCVVCVFCGVLVLFT